MDLQTLMQHINATYRSSDDDPPTSGDPEYDTWLLTINRKVSEWARDPKHKWASLWDDSRTLGTVSASTQAYELDDEILYPSDAVILSNADNQQTYFKLVKPQERGYGYNTAYIWGRDPQTLTFYDEFQADSQLVGQTISLAGYFMPDELVLPTDTVPVDDPYWLVMSVAAHLAFTDDEYENRSVDLQGQANALYSGMIAANRNGTFNNPRTVPTNTSGLPSMTYDRFWGR